MGRAIDQDNRLDDHDRRIEILEGVVEELSRSLMNTKKTKNVDLHDALEQHEREIRENLEKEEVKKTTKAKSKVKKTVEVD